MLELFVVNRNDLHGVTNGIIFELLLKHIVPVWPFLAVFQAFPLLEVIPGSLIQVVVVVDTEVVVQPRTQIYQA